MNYKLPLGKAEFSLPGTPDYNTLNKKNNPLTYRALVVTLKVGEVL